MKHTSITSIDRHEQSWCACAACRQFCRASPGILAPGDAERIAAYLGEDCDDEFLAGNFYPALLPDPDDQRETMPALRPNRGADGKCVFLTGAAGEERCSIHPVAPAGCRRINACEDGKRAVKVAKTILRLIGRSVRYVRQWQQVATDRLSAGE